MPRNTQGIALSLLSLVLISRSATAQIVYVDRDASGNNTGVD